MAITKRSGQVLLHFLARFAGLTSLLAGVASLVVWFVTGSFVWLSVALVTAALVLLAMIIEIRLAAKSVMSRRGALGSTVALQTLLAVALLLLVNLFSYWHHARWDLTRDQLFTISPEIQQRLANLRDDTTIVLHLRHVSFGQRTEKMDNYDAAAERKVVDKVKDLVEQFQQLGAKFKVHTLDIQQQDYKERIEQLTDDRPKLRDAIDRSTENAIFFYSDGDVGKLRFSDMYQLDKAASRQRGNLVLRPQGIESFTDRLLNIDEQKPRVTVAVTDAMFGLESEDETIGMSRVNKILQANGFDPGEVILQKIEFKPGKQGRPMPALVPAASTRDEDRFPLLEKKIATLADLAKQLKDEIDEYYEQGQFLKKLFRKSFDEINKKYGYLLIFGRPGPLMERSPDRDLADIDAQYRDIILERQQDMLSTAKERLARVQQRLDQTKQELSNLDIDDLEEMRRISDVSAKLKRLLENTDLLIVPRFTLHNIKTWSFPAYFHNLETAQVEPIRAYLKSGKPALFCLGPTNEDPRSFQRFQVGTDRLEDLLGELHFKLPKQTILYDVETERIERQRPDGRTTQVDIPAVQFDQPKSDLVLADPNDPNPIQTSMSLFSYDLDPDMQLRLRHARPVYYSKKLRDDQPAAVFMMSDRDSWSENQPFDLRRDQARYDPAKLTGVKTASDAIEQRGPLPVAVAVETKIPAAWFDDIPKTLPTTRVAVIGHGGIFSGTNLSPVQEKLFLDVVNWLLGREQLLTGDAETWAYPRAQLTARQVNLWKWGAALGLPLLCIYSGFVVLLIRRMR